jgi:phage terminase large subunit
MVIEKPNERQLQFFKAKTRHIGYGGARGGGKSWAMRTLFVILAFNFKGLKLLLLRRTMPELRENHALPLMKYLYGVAKYHKHENAFEFQNGSRIKLGYCDTEGDVYQYQGQEYDVVGFEEATHFTEFMKDFILTCNRSTRDDFKPRAYYTANPSGVGHNWFKRLFIDRDYQNKEKSEDYTFIPATVYDNKILMENNPEYVTTLENLPEIQRRAFLYGDWDIFEGQFFSEWKRQTHMVEPFDVPQHWRRWVSMDFGYNDACAIYWHCADEDGRYYTYKEVYINKTLVKDLAVIILDNSKGEKIEYFVGSPDMWAKRGNDSMGESIADTFARLGVPFIKADNQRVLGWQRMREVMSNAPDGLPYWQVFSTCKNLIRTIPIQQFHKHKLEDISDDSDDHAVESCRYFFMSRPRKSKEKAKELTLIQKHKKKVSKRRKENESRWT